MYGHTTYIIIHIYGYLYMKCVLCMYIHIYTHSCMKNFLSDIFFHIFVIMYYILMYTST